MAIVHRYDDTDHHIFKTLETEHKGDFYNASASLEVPECGPRQPWHDIHRYPLNIFSPVLSLCRKQGKRFVSLETIKWLVHVIEFLFIAVLSTQ